MILVTGSTGLVGSRLIYDLALSGKEVRAMRRKSADPVLVNRLFTNHDNLLKHIEWTDGDVTDFFSLEDALQGVTEVYHCAALVSFHPADYRLLMKVNAEGTANVVNAALAAGIKKLCYVSSTAALGRSDENSIITESSSWKNSPHNSAYAISKHGAEREVWRSMEEGLNAIIVNPSIILGSGHLYSGSTALFGAVLKGLKFYPSGASGFVDVRDVTRCMIRLMEKGIHGERYIINSENLPYRDVLNGIAEGFGKPAPVFRAGTLLSELGWRAEALRKFFTPHKPLLTKETARNGLRSWLYSNEKIKSELGSEFIPIHQTIADACRSFLGHTKN